MSDTRNINPDPFLFHEEEQEEFNIKEVLYKYLAYWKWFVLSFALAMIFAFLYVRYKTPLFNIQSSILIKDEKKGMNADGMLKELDLFSSSKVVDNEVEILRSFTLMEKVVTDLNLNVRYFAVKTIKDSELYDKSPIHLEINYPTDLIYQEPLEIEIINNQSILLNKKPVALDQDVLTPFGNLTISLTGKNPEITNLTVSVAPLVNVVEGFIQNIKVEPSSKMSSVLILSIEDAKPQRGKDLLNNLIIAYNHAALEDKNIVASNTLVFIEDRLKLLSGDLSLVEKNVEEFKSREGITDISVEAKLFLESVQENDIQLNQVKIQQSVLGAIEEYIRNNDKRSGTVPATIGISDPTLLSLINHLTELELQKERTARLIKGDNPIVLSLESQIQNLKASIYENIQSLKKNLSLTAQQLQNQNRRLEAMIKTIPGKERALVDISRQQAIKNNLYMFLLEKREETALSFASAVSDSRTIDTARSSIKPVRPVKRNIYLLFALMGLAIPFGFVYAIDLFNDKIKRRRDIEKATQAPILGELSWTDHQDAIVINSTDRSMFAEQIRAIRTNLSFLSIGKDVQSILFTSSMSGEGKSFISLNLGASLAITGKKTVILEFDMRKPKLGAALRLPEAKGLSNYLIGRAEINEIIRAVPSQENFYIITCGPIPPNPVELLVNGRLEILMAELRQQFDHIIIDAPPVGIVTDAQLLEKQADATLFVLRHNYSPKERIKIADSLYKDSRFKNMNIIFNGIKEGGKYGYGYRYGYGYYQDTSIN
ncbi:MAG: polysaccharide biosynthesis tyrosine autokinase [Bacteroidota bacterium]|nr:polysaccharide biosynthesis tyrosine autokinase [Bacteroidota bacterium]